MLNEGEVPPQLLNIIGPKLSMRIKFDKQTYMVTVVWMYANNTLPIHA